MELSPPAPLGERHLLDRFDSGAPSLDDWLRRRARANQASGASRTFVVCEGDQVVAGQPLAKCGNSGRTSEPHLHIHHQRQDPRKVPFGFAEGLPLFFEHLDGPEHPQGGMRQDGDTLVLLGDYIRDLRTSTTAVQ